MSPSNAVNLPLSVVGSGDSTATDVAVCRCGAGPHREHDDRCAAGHVVKGNTAALVVGHRSPRAHQAHRPDVEARIAELIDGKGYPDDAPADLEIIAQHLAWAERWRAECNERIERSGGPLTSAGRERRALAVAEKWDRRVESWNREYSRYPASEKKAPTLEEVMAGD